MICQTQTQNARKCVLSIVFFFFFSVVWYHPKDICKGYNTLPVEQFLWVTWYQPQCIMENSVQHHNIAYLFLLTLPTKILIEIKKNHRGYRSSMLLAYLPRTNSIALIIAMLARGWSIKQIESVSVLDKVIFMTRPVTSLVVVGVQ